MTEPSGVDRREYQDEDQEPQGEGGAAVTAAPEYDPMQEKFLKDKTVVVLDPIFYGDLYQAYLGGLAGAKVVIASDRDDFSEAVANLQPEVILASESLNGIRILEEMTESGETESAKFIAVVGDSDCRSEQEKILREQNIDYVTLIGRDESSFPSLLKRIRDRLQS